MCGIAGYYGFEFIDTKKLNITLGLMKNRGPDASGIIKKKLGKKKLYFLHSRLSIIDLDKRANQPFIYKNLLLVFNGEIYNYIELRNDLIKVGYKFETNSDTEVLIKSIEYFGKRVFDKIEGMWAFAIFDLKKNKLILSRDRFGEKPLFYKKDESGIYFGSETKFIQSLYGKKLKPNLTKCQEFLSYGYNAFSLNDNSFIETIKNIQPSTNLIINKKNVLIKKIYWSLDKIKIDKNLDLKKHIVDIRKKLIYAIKIRLRSDVKDAFYLSGGVDSGTIVSVCKKFFYKKIESYSIFQKKNSQYDESLIIKKIARETNSKNYNIDTSQINIIKSLKEMVSYYNSPVLTLNNLAQTLLCKKMSKKKVKVIFSGVGSDEIFSGYYDHYLYHLADLKKKNYSKNKKYWEKNVKKYIRNPRLKNEKLSMSRLQHIKKFDFLLRKPRDLKIKKTKKILQSHLKTALIHQFKDNLEPMLYAEDLNSMKYSLENRSPFLDRNLTEKLFSINPRFFIQKGYAKYLLRSATKGILHNSVRLKKSKVGFNVSVNSIKGLNTKFLKLFLKKNNFLLIKFFRMDRLESFLKDIKLDKLNSEDDKFIFRLFSTINFLKLYYK
jgi:asparagine synthase (glutamine-hydrolysing)